METTFTAPGITCEGCAGTIRRAIGAQTGVRAVEVDIAAKRVTVDHDTRLSQEQIAEALSQAGYPIANPHAQPTMPSLTVIDMPQKTTVKDVVCGMNIDPATAAGTVDHDGTTYYFCSKGCVEKFRANPNRFLSPNAKIEPHDAPTDALYTCPMDPQIVQKGPGVCPICGMALEPMVATAGDDDNPELRDMTRRLIVCAILTVPLLALAMGEMLLSHNPSTTLLWVQFLLATPVVLWGGKPFFERGLASIRSGHLNMFTLIAIGTGVSFAYSVIATIFPNIIPASLREHGGAVPVYFEAAAVITTLVLLGQVLELRARSQTSSAIKSLLGLAPKTARRLAEDGSEVDVPLEHVYVGDRLRIRPGEKVPVDGVVLEGSSAVDESMVSGEPVPVAKTSGQPLIGGTLNGTGALIMRAERVGSETMLAQIVRLVGEAQRTKAPIQRLADIVSGTFVPIVLAISVITFAAWAIFGPEPRLAYAFVNAVAVLIIACPCALGLATPMSIMVGTGRGATSGILIRNAEALETLEKVDTIVFDKTGTLTQGKPRLVSIVSAGNQDETVWLRLAASLEKASEHPLASAIVAGAETKGFALAVATDVQSQTGKGIQGCVEGKTITIGNQAMLGEGGFKTLVDQAETLRKDGQTVVFVAIDGKAAGLLGITDPIKDSAAEAIRDLHAQGLRVEMLTGDNLTTATAVAQKLGLDGVSADILPEGKGNAIKSLQTGGHIVAMVGDGVNDAPALAQAHVGIAMGTGTDVAIESAGITLLSGDLRGIARSRKLSRATMRNIRQNLAFAFLYNILGIPIAAGVLYPVFGILLSPMIASAAMTFSSVSVIMNALRLRRIEL